MHSGIWLSIDRLHFRITVIFSLVHDTSGAKVVNAPVTLKTEGKADVIVTILQSPDDQELCFVNDSGFRDLSQETNEKVDWERYDKLNATQKKYLDKFKPKE